MILKDVREKIGESPNKEWFKNKEETLNFSYIGFSQKFIGIASFFQFVEKQNKGWEKIEKELGALPDNFQNSKNYYNQLQRAIESFLNNYGINELNDNYLNSYWNSNINRLLKTHNFPLLSESSEVLFLCNIHKNNSKYFEGAFNGVVGQTLDITNNHNNLIGKLLAYEFQFKDKSEIFNRRKLEKQALNSEKKEFEKFISESNNQLIDHLKNTTENYNNYITEIDDLKEGKEKLFDEWFNKTKNEDWNIWYQEKLEILSELEKKYDEKLMFKKPADYWEKRGKELQKQGWISLGFLTFIIIITGLGLYFLLWITPEGIYESFLSDENGGDRSAAIRWSIIFLMLISFIAYGIKSLSKFMFSSFHLARDSQEKYTLTYFYLSLDKNVSKEDRQLILQSLFARAETGLLKEDSSPSMPNDLVSRLLSK